MTAHTNSASSKSVSIRIVAPEASTSCKMLPARARHRRSGAAALRERRELRGRAETSRSARKSQRSRPASVARRVSPFDKVLSSCIDCSDESPGHVRSNGAKRRRAGSTQRSDAFPITTNGGAARAAATVLMLPRSPHDERPVPSIIADYEARAQDGLERTLTLQRRYMQLEGLKTLSGAGRRRTLSAANRELPGREEHAAILIGAPDSTRSRDKRR
jgi:hypothetical protein